MNDVEITRQQRLQVRNGVCGERLRGLQQALGVRLGHAPARAVPGVAVVRRKARSCRNRDGLREQVADRVVVRLRALKLVFGMFLNSEAAEVGSVSAPEQPVKCVWSDVAARW